ncbi:MAG: hypothetical protein ABIO04_09200 [Ferruginibacter sp.]
MKHLFTLIGLFVSGCLFAQGNNCDSIAWAKDRKLMWTDFRATPDTSIKDVALSAIRLQKKWKLVGDTVSINIYSYFRPCYAWSKSKDSDTLLMHEQGHFNISEYFRRMMIKKLSEQNFKRRNLANDIQTIYLDINSQLKMFSELYDAKTDFSRNRGAQIEWTGKIMSMIDSLEAFADINIRKFVTE